ncbi:MAG: hypothetical protein ACREEM_12645 [Blastocatellia bacterium]
MDSLPFQTAVTSYGVNLCLRADRAARLAHFEKFWPYGCRETREKRFDRVYSIVEAGDGGLRLYADSRKISESDDAEDLCQRFRAHAQLYIAATTDQRVFIHAGVVAFRNGAILVPGRSLAGKTSLVAEFIKAGAIYFSDEYAVLDARGRVHPFPRPLSIRHRRTGKQRDVPVTSLGGQAAAKPAPVRLILATKHRKGARWQPTVAGVGEAIRALTLNAVSIRRNPAAALQAIARASAGAKVLKGARGEARQLVRDVMNRFPHLL